MAIFVVIRVIDTAYAQLDGALVQFKVGGGAFVTLPPASIAGATGHETVVNALAGTTTRCTVRVTKAGLFPVQQDLLLSTTERPASLAFDGAQDINVRNIDRHSRDSGDINFDVFVVPGELRDASSSIPPVLAQTPPLFPPPNPNGQRRPPIPQPILDPGRVQNVVDLAAIILSTPSNPAAGQHRQVTAKLGGKLFFVERTTVPQLLAVYVPDGLGFIKQFSTTTRAPVPRAYHLFFHPSIPDHFTSPYPFSYSYIDLVARYLRAEQHWAIGKELMYQHEASTKRCILVFPVGAKGAGFGTLATQRNVLKLLHELNYWIQRMVGVAVPSQPEPVAHLAVSGFSAGIRQVQGVLSQDRVAAFNDDVLREVYSFDGIFVTRDADNKEVLDVASTDACCAAMRAWFRGGQNARALRIYTQGRIWFDRLKDVFPGATLVQGRDGALETSSAQSTILFAPSVFWTGLNEPLRSQAVSTNPGAELYKSVHQFIPALFAQHAIKFNAMG